MDAQQDSAGGGAPAARAVRNRSLNVVMAMGLLCTLLLVLCTAVAPGALAQAVTLRLALPVSLDSPTGQNVRELARQAHARTDGALKIEILGKDEAFDERGIVSAVSSGAVEIGATPLNQFALDVPLAGVFLQPFLFNFDALVRAATGAESEVRTLIDGEILKRIGARVLWWQPYGSSVILSKGMHLTRPPLGGTTVIGAPDKQVRDMLRVCGVVAVPASPLSLPSALRDGTMQAGAADIMNVAEHELWRVADTITNLRHGPSLFIVVINDKAWQQLSVEHRDLITELAQEAEEYMWARFATVREQAYALAVQRGMRVVEVLAEDVAAWRACSAPLLEEYMERAGPAGARLFAAYGKLRTLPCCRDAPGEDKSLLPR